MALKKQSDPAHFGIKPLSGAGKGDKTRTDTNAPAYQQSPLWTRSLCCKSKVTFRGRDILCNQCNHPCETYQK